MFRQWVKGGWETYKSYKAYGVNTEEEYNDLISVCPDMAKYPTISSYAESLINFDDCYELTGSL